MLVPMNWRDSRRKGRIAMRQLLIDVRDKTLDLKEPGLRLIDAKTKEHVASILPDDGGWFHHHAEDCRLAAEQSYS